MTDDGFTRCFNDIVALIERSEIEIADELRVSRPTVQRWMNGTNLPHPGMRRAVLVFLTEMLVDECHDEVTP
jgi:hypothetical protein